MTKNLKSFRDTVPVEDIPEDGLHLIFEDMQGLLSDTEECGIQSTVKGEVFLHRVDGDVHLDGKVAALIVIKCDRCLEGYNAPRMSGGHEGKLACPRGHPLDPLVGRSEAEASKRILDPRGIGTPRSGVPTRR